MTLKFKKPDPFDRFRLGEYPSEHPLATANIAMTVYYATGIDDLRAEDSEGRPCNLLEEGQPIKALFG